MKMRFVLNDNVYHLENLSEVQSALGFEREPDVEENVLAVLFLMTKQALMQNANTLLTLATNNSEFDYLHQNIIDEINEFRNFLSAIESTHPSIPVRAAQLLERSEAGEISINGQDITLIVENNKNENDVN